MPSSPKGSVVSSTASCRRRWPHRIALASWFRFSLIRATWSAFSSCHRPSLGGSASLLAPPAGGGPSRPPARLQRDLRQALSLIATRVAGRGVTAAMRERGGPAEVQNSPFYKLIFVTQELTAATDGASAASVFELWQKAVSNCRKELALVRLGMETTGVSADLVLDLRSIELALMRMHGLARVLAFDAASLSGSVPVVPDSSLASRNLLSQLIEGRLEDKRVSSLFKQNLNLLARKTVERTGHSGEHYIAHTRKEYGQMWLAAVGGGLLTVLTAAIKMRIVEHGDPLFVEGFLTGTNYAVSFILLQVFGLVLATKQPSATAATFAGIVRNNPGSASWSKISDFTARISRTQLAAAIGNVIAVCIGSVALERLWRVMFAEHYLPAESARHVYEALHPFASGTIIYAAGTGVILWLAALIGGWCENFAVFHRLTEAVPSIPLAVALAKTG